ncbi:prenyltransferase/squalene oxidase repeat-containing protein [Paraburkholderia aspalathi]|uniref:prenyltransferase/squalene oxidase repeat-containing protein n=1 Tax=Paraburkholderia aspalathi TaxID=1324617 RepID=UPI0038BC5ED3
MERFISSDGVWAVLTPRGEPDCLYGHRLRSSALGALSWSALHVRGEPKAAAYAVSALRHVQRSHRHVEGSGFWDRTDAQSQVRVDPLSAVYGRSDSPFPVKLSGDHALLALAAHKVASYAGDINEFETLVAQAHAELRRYTDKAVGGIFLGQGSWFSPPVDPTVPLARHVMVSPRAVGAFSVGNTAYVPFHEKHAETQFLALSALERVPHRPEISQHESVGSRVIALPFAPYSLDMSLDYVTTGQISSDLIDLQAYLSWLRATASGLGYGLTPYRAPLGLRSDRTAQTFSALHVISDLLTLCEPIPNQQGLLTGIFATQNPDGGFGEQPGLLSEVFTSYFAVLTARVLNNPGYDTNQCIRFLNACQHADGGFGNAPGYPSDCWHSNLAVLALHALGCRPPNEQALVSYLIHSQNADGGYGEQFGHPSDTFATFRAVDSLISLGLRPPRMDETIAWLRGLQTEAGGFRDRNTSVESFVGSYHAIAALYVMGAQPIDVPACLRWIAARQSADGGFSRHPGGPSDTTDEGFIAIQALHMLENKLNPYWAVIMT